MSKLKIAVIGGNDTVIGFKAVGLEAFPAANAAEAASRIAKTAQGKEKKKLFHCQRL